MYSLVFSELTIVWQPVGVMSQPTPSTATNMGAEPVQPAAALVMLAISPDVEGTATTGDGGIPLISASHITVLGRGKLPQPQRLSLNELMSGHVEAQWVEVEGIVRSTRRRAFAVDLRRAGIDGHLGNGSE